MGEYDGLDAARGALSRRDVIVGSAAAGLALASPPAFAQAGANLIRLRILETTDIHVHVQSYDYYRDQPDDTVGLARIATLVDRARAARATRCSSRTAISCRAIRWAT